MHGQLTAGEVKREFGCAPGTPEAGSHGSPFQLSASVGGSLSSPSHQTVPSGLRTTFVKMVFLRVAARALGFVFSLVPGATPKKPFSGLTAQSRPSGPGRSQAISSPTHQHFQPFSRHAAGGMSIARLVLPQADGNAPQIYRISPLGFCTPRMSMCSASHPSLRPSVEAMRSAKHFLPSSALPP